MNLDPEKIVENRGLRKISKLCLNSLWGKFGERENKPQHKLIRSVRDFYAILLDDKKIVKDFVIVNEDTIIIQFVNTCEDERYVSSNVFIAMFTTCLARLRLYEVLDAVGESCLYYDTDSVIYVEKDNERLTTCGDHLGELTSELAKGEHIIEFVSTGPKSYAYKTSEGTMECKVKGCTLNYRNCGSLNFASMKNMVTVDKNNEIVTKYPSKITRTKNLNIKSTDMTKVFRFTCNKRVLRDGFDTIPYGY